MEGVARVFNALVGVVGDVAVRVDLDRLTFLTQSIANSRLTTSRSEGEAFSIVVLGERLSLRVSVYAIRAADAVSERREYCFRRSVDAGTGEMLGDLGADLGGGLLLFAVSRPSSAWVDRVPRRLFVCTRCGQVAVLPDSEQNASFVVPNRPE